MQYFGTASGPFVREAMKRGHLGQICTPAAGNAVLSQVEWCADNAVFANKYPGDEKYLAWLKRRAQHQAYCRFAVAPDVVGNPLETLLRSALMLPRIRAAGWLVALAAQDGLEDYPTFIPWHAFDALFIGGSTEWKIGPGAARLGREAKARGKWLHMGRVNSLRRMKVAHAIGCDSVDGTFLSHGPDIRLPEVLAWLSEINKTPYPLERFVP